MSETVSDPAVPSAPPSPTTQPSEGYRVLARKYRPSTFDDLVGQEPMVRTLRNAFATGRIAQAYMLTGVRGVGKTTTARILARALNYETDAIHEPTIDMPVPGEHCPAIMEGRHVDVIEMDAASHTGIDDIREVISGVRYRPTVARYKVYIVDEVHMLSKSAFNALLKTLEEPPEHVKFVFATTEIRKVPITVLSRCQRFDLRRIGSGELMGLLGRVCEEEGVTVEDGALAAIARAGEGSARDALSLLDQAIAHAAGTGTGRVEAEGVRAMLGLADRARVIDLFDMLMRGDVPAALAELAAQYEQGAEPATVLTDLAQFVHFVTRVRFVDEALADPALTEEERTRGREFADGLDVRVLGRAWQMLLKGIEEVSRASRPLAAADMVLVRIAHAADMPTLDEVMRRVAGDGDAPATIATSDSRNGATANGSGAARPNGGGAASAVAADAVAPAGDGGTTMRAEGGAVRAEGGAVRLVRPLPEEPEPEPDPGPDPGPAPEPSATPPAGPRIDSFEHMLREAEARRDIRFLALLRKHVDPIELEAHENGGGRFTFRPANGAPGDLANMIAGRLRDWTGRTWPVMPSDAEGTGTVRDREEGARRSLMDEALADPTVQAVLQTFPGAKVVDIRDGGADAAQAGVPDVALATGEPDELTDEVLDESDMRDGDDPGAGDLDDYF